MPCPNMATSRATGSGPCRCPLSRAIRSQFRAADAPLGRASEATTRDDHPSTGQRQAARRHIAVTPVVARPAQDDDRPGRPIDRGPIASALTAAATAVPACSIRRSWGSRAPGPCGRRRSSSRPRSRERGAAGPCRRSAAEVHREDRGSSAGNGGARRASGIARWRAWPGKRSRRRGIDAPAAGAARCSRREAGRCRRCSDVRRALGV